MAPTQVAQSSTSGIPRRPAGQPRHRRGSDLRGRRRVDSAGMILFGFIGFLIGASSKPFWWQGLAGVLIFTLIGGAIGTSVLRMSGQNDAMTAVLTFTWYFGVVLF